MGRGEEVGTTEEQEVVGGGENRTERREQSRTLGEVLGVLSWQPF